METRFDFQSFLLRTRLKQREVAEKTGVSSGLVGTWASGKARPSYETILKLIECGISASELFGKEAAQKLLSNSGMTAKISKEDFMAGVREALSDISKINQ